MAIILTELDSAAFLTIHSVIFSSFSNVSHVRISLVIGYKEFIEERALSMAGFHILSVWPEL
jgi:hypothetical protein